VGGRRNLATLKIPPAGNIPLVVEWQGRGCFRRGSVDLKLHAKVDDPAASIPFFGKRSFVH
jgi:hypothetical protein